MKTYVDIGNIIFWRIDKYTKSTKNVGKTERSPPPSGLFHIPKCHSFAWLSCIRTVDFERDFHFPWTEGDWLKASKCVNKAKKDV